MDSPDLHSRLKNLRQEKGYTQNDIAKKLDISRQAISRWENGHASPDIVNLTKLSEIYGISVKELMGTDASDSEEKQEPMKEQEGAEKTDDTFPKISPLKQEYLLLLLILVLTSYNTIIGFIVSCYIFIWTLLKRRNYKFLILLSAVSIIHHFRNLLVIISLYIPDQSSVIIEKID